MYSSPINMRVALLAAQAYLQKQPDDQENTKLIAQIGNALTPIDNHAEAKQHFDYLLRCGADNQITPTNETGFILGYQFALEKFEYEFGEY